MTRQMELDRKDLEILNALYELADSSPKRISEAVDIPKSTVHFRIEKLREKGILKNDLLEIDPEVAGFDVTVISEVVAEYDEGYQEDVGERIAEVEGVSQVHFTMGDTDFVVISHLTDSDAVQRVISAFQGIDEIQRTSSKFVITTIKNDPNPIRNYSLDSLIDIREEDE